MPSLTSFFLLFFFFSPATFFAHSHLTSFNRRRCCGLDMARCQTHKKQLHWRPEQCCDVKSFCCFSEMLLPSEKVQWISLSFIFNGDWRGRFSLTATKPCLNKQVNTHFIFEFFKIVTCHPVHIDSYLACFSLAYKYLAHVVDVFSMNLHCGKL